MDHIIIHRGWNVSLAVVQEGYLPHMVTIINNPEISAGVMSVPPCSHEEEQEWFSGLTKNKNSHHVLAVLVHEGDGYRFIGVTGLHKINKMYGYAESGSLLGNPGELGHGFGTEAKLLLLKHAFDVLNLTTVQSGVKAFNGQSLGHLLKCGYQVVGTVPEKFLYQARRVDEVRLYTKRAHWEPIWQTYLADSTLPKLTDRQREFVRTTVNKATNKK